VLQKLNCQNYDSTSSTSKKDTHLFQHFYFCQVLDINLLTQGELRELVTEASLYIHAKVPERRGRGHGWRQCSRSQEWHVLLALVQLRRLSKGFPACLRPLLMSWTIGLKSCSSPVLLIYVFNNCWIKYLKTNTWVKARCYVALNYMSKFNSEWLSEFQRSNLCACVKI